jgi:MFS family permease
MNSMPPVQQPAAAGPGEPQKSWRAGALVYTGAGLAVLFCWLLWGDFAWQLKERAVTPVGQLMLKRLQASDFLVGLLIGSLPAALGMILGPVISVKSDRHRGRWGRRIPFLLVATPIAAAAMMALAAAPAVGGWLHEVLGARSPGPMAASLIVFGVFWTVFEMASVVANAVFGGLINDVVPQEIIGRFFGLFRAVSLIAGIVFNFWIMGHAESHFVAIFLGIGLLYGAGFMVMCLKVREGAYPPPPPVSPDGPAHPLKEAGTYLRECYGNSYYLWLFVGYALAMLAAGPVNSFSVFYAKSLGMGMDAYGKCLALTYAISLVFSYFLGVLADRFHPLRVGIAATCLYAAAMLWGGFFARTAGTFAVAFVLHGVLSGVFLTTTASIGQRLFPSSKFAQFASANGIIIGLGFLLLPPFVGMLLDVSGHIYRYTFFCAGVLGLAGAAFLLVAHRKFMALGGPRHYVAPE